MDHLKKESIVHSVIAGQQIVYLDDKIYIVHSPSRIVRLQAHRLYKQVVYRCSFENMLTQDKAVDYLTHIGLWSKEKEHQLKTIDDTIDKKKVELYKSILNILQQKEIKRILSHLRKNKYKLLEDKHRLDDLTIEYHAEMLSKQFIVLSSLTTEDNVPLFKDKKSFDVVWDWFNRINFQLAQQQYALEEYREVARTEPWLSYWAISNDNPFGNAVADWTQEQRTLVLYSRMYDNARQHPDFPGNHIIDDDDIFDGWLLVIKDADKQKQKTKSIDHVNPRFSKADEVYIVARDDEEAKEIHDMNTFDGKLTKKRREARVLQSIKGGKSLPADQLPDIKEKIYMQAQQAMMERAKG